MKKSIFALNPYIIGRPADFGVVAKFCHDFKQVDIPFSEFAEHIKRGCAFTAQFANGKRSNSNFLSSGFLAVDIDGDNTLEAVMEADLFKQHCGLLYTTASHTDGKHHLRLVFELATPITDASLMRKATLGLIAMFRGDIACSDQSRLYFGWTGTGTFLFREVEPLPESIVNELVNYLGYPTTDRKRASCDATSARP